MKRYYYHITTKNWPDDVTLKPRKYGANRASEEPKISRICVAPTIEGCLIALGSCLTSSSDIYIYRTVNKIKAVNPHGVIDSKVTGEMWLIKPIKFKYIGCIKKRTLPKYLYFMIAGHKKNLKNQAKYKKSLKKNMKSYI